MTNEKSLLMYKTPAERFDRTNEDIYVFGYEHGFYLNLIVQNLSGSACSDVYLKKINK